MNKINFGWLVGIIDGEGCLTIRIHKKKTKHYGIRPRFQTQLTVSNTEKEITEKCAGIMSSLGIKSRVFVRKKQKGKDQWIVEIYSNSLRKLLPLIKDYSCKRGQVDVLLEAIKLSEEHKNEGNIGGWGRKPFSLETLQKFDALRMRLQELHGRQSKKLQRITAEKYDISEEIRQQAKEKQQESRKKAISKNIKYGYKQEV